MELVFACLRVVGVVLRHVSLVGTSPPGSRILMCEGELDRRSDKRSHGLFYSSEWLVSCEWMPTISELLSFIGSMYEAELPSR